jgi:hypothetical protein
MAIKPSLYQPEIPMKECGLDSVICFYAQDWFEMVIGGRKLRWQKESIRESSGFCRAVRLFNCLPECNMGNPSGRNSVAVIQ